MTTEKRELVGQIQIGIAMAMYVLSLALPALQTPNGEVFSGLLAFLFGSFWVFVNGTPAWFANPIFYVALWPAFSGYRGWASSLAALAFLLGLSAPALPPREGTVYLAGYLCWIGSFLVLAGIKACDMAGAR